MLKWVSLVAQTVKGLSVMLETRLRSLGREDPLEKEMAIHSSTLAWKIPWTEEPGRLHTVRRVTKSPTQLSDLTLLMLKSNLQYFGHLMRKANSLEKTLMLGKIEDRRRRGRQRTRWLDDITD